MTIATICLYVALHSDRARWFFISGLALGACASVRALYGPLVPCVLAWMFLTELRMSKRLYSKTLALFAGAIGGLAPMIFSFFGDPRAFIFNNVQYHGLDAGYRWVNGKPVLGYRGIGQTLDVYFRGIGDSLLAHHPYFTVEVLLALAGGLSLLYLDKKQTALYSDPDYLYFQLAFLMLAVYTATAIIPFPPYDQYFTSPMVPFLLLRGGRLARRPFALETLESSVGAHRFAPFRVISDGKLFPTRITRVGTYRPTGQW